MEMKDKRAVFALVLFKYLIFVCILIKVFFYVYLQNLPDFILHLNYCHSKCYICAESKTNGMGTRTTKFMVIFSFFS